MRKKQDERNITENPLYHDTWKLLKKYRDVVWSLELSIQQVRNRFELEYGSSIEDFLDSVYLAGADLSGSDTEHHAKCIERSYRMLKLLDSSVDLLRNKHRMERSITGLFITHFFRRSNSAMWKKSLKNSDRIFGISVFEHITEKGRKRLKRSVRSYGDILPRTVWRFWISFSQI